MVSAKPYLLIMFILGIIFFFLICHGLSKFLIFKEEETEEETESQKKRKE